MKSIILLVLVFVAVACEKSTHSTGQNRSGTSKTISVFDVSDNLNPDNLKHVKQELVAPPFLPKHQQVVSEDPVVIEVTMTIEE